MVNSNSRRKTIAPPEKIPSIEGTNWNFRNSDISRVSLFMKKINEEVIINKKIIENTTLPFFKNLYVSI
jgi:hypothetical protein